MADHSTVARPYAKALFDLANGERKLAAWSEALNAAAAVLADPNAQARARRTRRSTTASAPTSSADERGTQGRRAARDGARQGAARSCSPRTTGSRRCPRSRRSSTR